MAIISAFRALRPESSEAERVAAVPYDVVDRIEAFQQAGDNPLSFLRVSRAEIDLQASIDPYDELVYRRAVENFRTLRETALVLEDEPSVYVYRLRMGTHEQTGVAACYSLDEYDAGLIKKHERTRRDKEDDRTRHMLELRAQTGPVFLTYRDRQGVTRAVDRITGGRPLIDFTAADGVRHTLWRAVGGERDELIAAFEQVPSLYIADGHHRAASAARVRDELRLHNRAPTELENDPDSNAFLAVAFPHNQVQILPYNRVVKDLKSLSPAEFLERLRDAFTVTAGPAAPARRGEMSMYLDGQWYTIKPKNPPSSSDPIAGFDVTVLQDQLLDPILGISDIRTDKRIDFVGGARGTDELQRLVDLGSAAVAFSMYPVSVDDLMKVSDAGAIMPPKSTWFEPKLRDGLLIHLI